MKIYFTAFILTSIFISSCSIKISEGERRRESKIDGPAAEAFKEVMKTGKILNELEYENYRFILVRKVGDAADKKVYFFLEEMIPKRVSDGSDYKRSINVYLLSDPSKNSFALNTASFKPPYNSFPLQKISSFLNSSAIEKDFITQEVFYKKGVTFKRGLFVEKVPCSNSVIIDIDDFVYAKEGYENDVVHCIPSTIAGDSILTAIKNGEPVFWKPIPAVTMPGIPKAKDEKTDAIENGSDYTFSHSCNKNVNFTLLIKRESNGGFVSIHNNIETNKQIINDTVKRYAHETNTTVTSGKRDTVRRKTDTSYLIRELIKPKDTLYRFSNSFDPINFVSWIENKYSRIDISCAQYLAYKVNEELLWSDSAYLKYKYGKEYEALQKLSTDKPADVKEKKETVDKSAKPANVKIIATPATVMQPIYSSKGQILPVIIPVKLKLAGPYDSLANAVAFKMLDSNLLNNLKIYDTTITIPKADWNNALANGGELDLNLAVKSSTIKDTLGNIQKGYIVLKGQPSSLYGFHEVQLTSFGVYNPNKPFWVEVGSNFDFSDGLQPNNFFGGVFLHKRDIRPFISLRPRSVLSKMKRPTNFGLFAGVFESKSISETTDSSFYARKYYNTNSLALSRRDSSGVFTDSGSVKNRQVVKNIGLFFSPQVRLTNGSANSEGLHISASLWLELQWQVISSETDYSGLARSDTFFVPNRQINLYAARSAKSEIDIRSHYFGLGLPMFYKEGDANVFFNPVIGMSNQPAYQVVRENLKLGARTELIRAWNPFYVFQFRLNEEHFGIAFTGEVRGLFLKGSKPVVSIALSKKFDLSKFLEFK